MFHLILRIFPLTCFLKEKTPFYERNVHGKIAEMKKSSSSLPLLLCPARKNTLTSSWLPSWNGLVTSTRCLQGKSKVNISLQGREPHHHDPRWAKIAGGKPCAGSRASGLAKGSERVWRSCRRLPWAPAQSHSPSPRLKRCSLESSRMVLVKPGIHLGLLRSKSQLLRRE